METASCHEVNHDNVFCVSVVVVSVEGRWENQNCSYHQSLNQSLTLVDGLTDSQPGLVLEAKMSQLIRFSGKTVTEKITVVNRQHREVELATVYRSKLGAVLPHLRVGRLDFRPCHGSSISVKVNQKVLTV